MKEAPQQKTFDQLTPLPCPFCGSPGKAEQEKESPPEITKIYFSCGCRSKACHVYPLAFGDTQEEAVRNWNTQPQLGRIYEILRNYHSRLASGRRPQSIAVQTLIAIQAALKEAK